MKVGILTGGGDCPGLNAVIRGVVRVVHNGGGQILGLVEGWRGAIEGDFVPLHPANTDDIVDRGGTILGSSRTNPYKDEALVEKLIATFHRLGLDALVAIGGDDTLGVANRLFTERHLPVVGCPKTIDNDLSSTDVTFGFDTSINIVMEAVDRLRTTAESHRRVMVIETMGRHAGWIACYAGMATAADFILVPEVEVDFNRMCNLLVKRREAGKKYGVIVVSEGAKLPDSEEFVTRDAELDEFGHVKLGGVGELVADVIERRTGIETRWVTLGHLQRGGTPSAYDRVLGTRLGIHAGRLVIDRDFGKMVALRGTDIVAVPLSAAVGKLRTLDLDFLKEAEEFFQS
ncbi:MAG: ATP-dependent 6-phosphofructokinase [Planctomycetes bacterium]|nr:ATP-dependent 6-phosphofructokinase [Planctomycetota bacterium]